MNFDSIVRSIIEEKQMHCWKGYKKKGTKKLSSGKVVNNCVKEAIINTHTYKVSHNGLGISEKTTAKDEGEALRNIFGRLKKEGKLQSYQYKQFKDAEVKEI